MKTFIFYNLEEDKKLEIEGINLVNAYAKACQQIPISERDKWAIGTK